MATVAIGFQGRLTLQMDAGRPMTFVTGRPVLDLTTLTIGRTFLTAPKLPARLNWNREGQSQHRHYKSAQGSKSSHRRHSKIIQNKSLSNSVNLKTRIVFKTRRNG
jgi:hypothetical protein